jgi:hypothetical protein
MVEAFFDDLDIMRERFDRLLNIPENERKEENLFELMRMTARLKIFESLKMTDMHKEICRKMFARTYNKDQIVFKQGDEGDAFYFVLRGCIDLFIYDVDQLDGKTKMKYLTSVLPGNGFGELALLYDCPRTATAIPNSKTDLIVFKKKFYISLVKDLHERDIIDMVKFYYSIPIFKREPISNILKYCLRSRKQMVNAYRPFFKFNDYINEYAFVKIGVIKAYVKIRMNKTILHGAHALTESNFVEQLKDIQIKYSNKLKFKRKAIKVDEKPQDPQQEKNYDEVLDIMKFEEKEMFGEFYVSNSKRVDVHFIPNLPSEILLIKSEDLQMINPSLHEAIVRFSCPIFDQDRAFRKLHQTLVWKYNKKKLLVEALQKKD